MLIITSYCKSLNDTMTDNGQGRIHSQNVHQMKTYSKHVVYKFNSHLNSSPILDECGEGVSVPQACTKGNHDNPVSGNHPGTVTLNTQWNIDYLPRGRGGTGTKLFSGSVNMAQYEQNG